jgi:hypothetical protein
VIYFRLNGLETAVNFFEFKYHTTRGMILLGINFKIKCFKRILINMKQSLPFGTLAITDIDLCFILFRRDFYIYLRGSHRLKEFKCWPPEKFGLRTK